MKYIITVQEVWCREIPVEADSVDAALEKANQVIESGDVPDERFEYHSTYDMSDWGVFNCDTNDYEE